MLPRAIFDTSRSRSLRSTVQEAFRLVSMVRDRLSIDAWRIMHRIDEASQRGPSDVIDVLEFLDRLILDLMAFGGLAAESMTRTLGWRFLDLGRRLERSWQGSMLLRSTLITASEEEQPLLEALLQIADSLMTYRSRYLATVQRGPVLDLLVTDETNPRSIAFQLAMIVDHVNHLPRPEQQALLNLEQKLALSLLNHVRLSDIHDLAETDPQGGYATLERLLKRLCDQLPRLSDAVSARFLIHAGLIRQFASGPERAT
jgi:uncharacterized alpha-E superfamily protein